MRVDADTKRHIQEWLAREFGKRKTDTMLARYLARMVALIEREPEWLGRNWHRVLEAAR